MTLEQLFQAVDHLSYEELRELHEYVERRRREATEARVKAFDEAVAALQEGLSEEEIEEIVAAINYK